MTSIEVEEYLASQGMPEKQARATALAMEKFVAGGQPVSEKRLVEILDARFAKQNTVLLSLFFAQFVFLVTKGFGLL